MPGTKLGGQKAAATRRERYGDDFNARIGRIGGMRSKTGGFASQKVGKDGLTGPQRASVAGYKGGRISRRNKLITDDTQITYTMVAQKSQKKRFLRFWGK